MAEKSGKMSDGPEDKMAGGSDNMAEHSEWKTEVEWQEGSENDFKDFKEIMQNAKQSSGHSPSSSSSGEEEEKNGEKQEKFNGEREKKKGEEKNDMKILAEKMKGKEDNLEEDDIEEIGRKFEEYNKFIDTETEDEDNPDEDLDPGSDKPEVRILWAAQHNKLELVQEMLENKPGLVGARDEDLYTPLHRAAYSGHTEMVRLLLANGADPLALTDTGWTPLHSAAKWNNVDIVELLLNAGVPVNTVSEGGLTPLHVAAMSKSCRETIELLLMQPGVDLTLASNQGDTAAEIAFRNGPLGPLFQACWPQSTFKYRGQH